MLCLETAVLRVDVKCNPPGQSRRYGLCLRKMFSNEDSKQKEGLNTVYAAKTPKTNQIEDRLEENNENTHKNSIGLHLKL